MKYIFCVIFIFSFCVAYSQQPSGVPTQKINGWIQNWYTVPDSGIVAPRRDTNWTPSKLGMMITWPHAGVDTVPWFWNGAKWGKTFSPQATSDSSFFYIDYIPQTTDPSYNEGRLFYDNANKTLSLFDAISGTSLQIGQEQYARARNNTGSQINDGSVVYISGASGQTPTIALALANSTNTTGVLGVATHNISNNSVGKVTTFGLVNDINTSSFLAGDKLYLSPTTPGGITNVEPDVPNFSVFIGYCLNSHITQGKIFVSPIQRVVQIHQINDTSFVSIVGTIIDTIRISSAAAGTVTSVGLSMPSAFNVTGSPITSSGVFGVSGAGTALQYIRGNGTLATFDTTAIPDFYLKVRGLLSGTSPITYSTTTGAIGISNATATGTKGAASFTSSFSDNGSGQIDLLTLGTAGGCTKCNLTIDAKGRITAYSNNTAGIDTLNGLTAKTQLFATGTSGTDFNISSSVNTHTFNLPSASASARGVITTGAQTIAGVKSFSSDLSVRGLTVGIGGGSSISNTALGSAALISNSSGTANTAIGTSALANNTTGVNNIALGSTVMANNSTGSFNIAIGPLSQGGAGVASNNISIGYLTLNANQGSSNVVIGHLAGRQNNGAGNVFLGAGAGESETVTSNALIISNSSTKKLIHGDFTNDSVKINGKLKVRDVDSVTTPINVLLHDPSSNEIKKTSAAVIAALATIETALTASPNITTNHTTAIGSNRWQINGSDPSDYLFGVNNSTGGGIDIISANGNAVLATATASSGIAINGLALNGTGFNFTQLHSTSTNDITVLGVFSKSNISQTPAAGFGLANDYYLASAAGTSRQVGREAFKWTTATDASRTSMFELSTVNSGTLARKLAISGAGQATLDSYTGTTFQTTDTSYNALVVDASGNVYKRAGDANLTASGLYTPTVTGTLNVDAVTAHQCRYTRVGNIVFVGGVVEIDPTAASATSATITLPVSSTFTSSDDINGVVSVNELTTPNAHITRSGNIALLAFTSGTTSNFALYFTFSYEVK